MELHQSRLAKLCRVCGNIIVKDKHRNLKSALVYAEEIRLVYNVDVSKDKKHLHPEHICETCRKQFDLVKKKASVTVPKQQLFSFKHSDKDCFVCTIRTSRQKPISLHTVASTSEEKPKVWLNNRLIDKRCKELDLVNLSKITNSSTSEREYCIAKITIEQSIPKIVMSVTIQENCLWKFHVYGREVKIPDIPEELTEEKLVDICNILASKHICIGNNDFPLLLNEKISDCSFKDKTGESIALIETSDLQNCESFSTIRHKDCQVIVENISERCIHCTNHRKTLTSLNWRIKQPRSNTDPHKNVRNSFLSSEQLLKKTANLSREVKSLKRSISKYEQKVARFIEEVMPKDIHDICEQTLLSEKSPFSEDTPQYFLWEQQRKQASLKNPKSMKWYPVMIRWCMSLYLKSPGSYEQLRESGFLCLPHKTTILRYANYTDPKCGINIDVLKQLNTLTQNLEGVYRTVGILFDEMKIKSGLVYSRNTGKVIGFTDMGDINNELISFKNRIESDIEHPPIATHILTFMVRGLCSAVKFPFAYYAGQDFTSDQLFPCIWECVKALEGMNLPVVFLTSDGASPNRQFYKLHELDDSLNCSSDGVIYWCWNKYSPADNGRKLFFICDVPHLIKTIRNNFENSHFHNNTRNLMVNDRQISWQHIISALEYDMGPNKSVPGFRQTKLTTDHVFLTPSLRMNVSLAAQVLSNSVAVCLASQDKDSTIETRRFITYCNTFFDCLNVKNSSEGRKKRMENLFPYESGNDKRLKWLVDEFLEYLNSWQYSSQAMTNITKEERNRLCLSQQTLDGIRITIRSFVEIVPLMIHAGAKFILSDILNQDCLEEHFGKQRMKGGSRDNLTVQDYQCAELKLQAGAAASLNVLRGNTRGREKQKIDLDDETPLAKRKKKTE